MSRCAWEKRRCRIDLFINVALALFCEFLLISSLGLQPLPNFDCRPNGSHPSQFIRSKSLLVFLARWLAGQLTVPAPMMQVAAVQNCRLPDRSIRKGAVCEDRPFCSLRMRTRVGFILSSIPQRWIWSWEGFIAGRQRLVDTPQSHHRIHWTNQPAMAFLRLSALLCYD